MRSLRPCKQQWASTPLLLSRCLRYNLATNPACHHSLETRRYIGNSKNERQENNNRNPRLKNSFWKGVFIKAFTATAIATATQFVYFNILASSPSEIFQPPQFTPFKITSREIVSPTSILLTLRPEGRSESADPYKASWEKGTWSVEFKQPQLQIARSYTPLPPRPGDDPMQLRFLVRKEINGEVSGYLHKLSVDGTVQVRGPSVELELEENVKDVVFLAGGTGIAPALQVAHCLLQRREKHHDTQIKIIWANRRKEDCLGSRNFEAVGQTGYIVQELRALQDNFPSQVSVEYTVDEEGTFIDQKRISRLTRTHAGVIQESSKRLLVVSGPEGFINHFAGPKQWEGGKERQGQVGGVIGRLNLQGWEVWKL